MRCLVVGIIGSILWSVDAFGNDPLFVSQFSFKVSDAWAKQHRMVAGRSSSSRSTIPVPPRFRHRPSRWSSITSRQFAIIYGENGEAMDAISSSNDNDNNQYIQDDAWKESLELELDPALLIRVACALAPPPHTSLHPRDVMSATIVDLDLDRHQLDVALAIPQYQRSGTGGAMTCIQLLVPIVFPSPFVLLDDHSETNDRRDDDDYNNKGKLSSSSLSMVQQIRRMLDEMDVQAQQRIMSREKKQQEEEDPDGSMAARQAVLRSLEEEPDAVSLPDWWTFPDLKVSMAEECVQLKSLLNEDDFARDLRVLCQVHHHHHNDPNHSPGTSSVSTIVAARVASVGPSGIYLRGYASLVIIDKAGNDANDNDNERFAIIDVPIAFPKTTTHVEDLRSSVLDLVESIESIPEQEDRTVPPMVPTMIETTSNNDDETEQENESIPFRNESTVVAETTTNALETGSMEEDSATIVVPSRFLQQPLPADEEARLAAKYAAIEDVGDRAYAILKDLNLI